MTQQKLNANWDLQGIEDPLLRDLHAYWASLPRNGAVPLRSSFSPAAIPGLLPLVVMVDVLDEPRDFRFRLAGTSIARIAGQELTGKRIAEVFPSGFCAELHRTWGTVIAERRPVRGAGRLWVPGREHIGWEGLAMPLSRTGEDADVILGGVVFLDGAGKRLVR